VVYGITTQPESWNPLLSNFVYDIDPVKDASKAHSVGDAVRMLILAPGWKPAELGGMIAYREISPTTFEKYDTTIPRRLTEYILFQFIILLIGTSVFLFMEKGFDWPTRIAASMLTILSVVNIGGLFEVRRWAFIAEVLRMVLLSGLSYFFLAKYMGNIYAITGSRCIFATGSTLAGINIKKINLNKHHAISSLCPLKPTPVLYVPSHSFWQRSAQSYISTGRNKKTYMPIARMLFPRSAWDSALWSSISS
jgi:hypothetical protein